jgi:hypothetical protein
MVRIEAYPIGPDVTRAERNKGIVYLRNHMLTRFGRTESQPALIQWRDLKGLEYRESSDKNKGSVGIARLLVTKTHFYCVAIIGDGTEPTAEMRAACFDGFQILSADPIDRVSEAVLVDLSVRWQEHAFPQKRFKAQFCGEPISRELLNGDKGKPLIVRSFTAYLASSGLELLQTEVVALEFVPDITEKGRGRLMTILRELRSEDFLPSDSEPVEVIVGGLPGTEFTMSKGKSGYVARLVPTQTHAYLLTIGSPTRWPTNDERKLFFDSFQLLK